MVKKGFTKPIRLQDWDENIIIGMTVHNLTYNESLLYCIRYFFAFEYTKLPLTPPVYSRKLYKLGFVAPTRFGNSYKLANYKANKFFNKK